MDYKCIICSVYIYAARILVQNPRGLDFVKRDLAEIEISESDN